MERRPITTVDVVLLTLHEAQLAVALTTRTAEPFKGLLALPGGYVHVEQDQLQIIVRSPETLSLST